MAIFEKSLVLLSFPRLGTLPNFPITDHFSKITSREILEVQGLVISAKSQLLRKSTAKKGEGR
jgi:hypothetical protein